MDSAPPEPAARISRGSVRAASLSVRDSLGSLGGDGSLAYPTFSAALRGWRAQARGGLIACAAFALATTMLGPGWTRRAATTYIFRSSGNWSILAARIKSFSESPSMACVPISIVTLR